MSLILNPHRREKWLVVARGQPEDGPWWTLKVMDHGPIMDVKCRKCGRDGVRSYMLIVEGKCTDLGAYCSMGCALEFARRHDLIVYPQA